MDMMCRRTLLGHKDDVQGLAAMASRRRFTFDGEASRHVYLGEGHAALLCSASADGTLRVWGAHWQCICIFMISVPATPNDAQVGGRLWRC